MVKNQLSQLSTRLIQDFGKGFDVSNLRKMRQFYLQFPKQDALRLELSWTHYRVLMRLEKPAARDWYIEKLFRRVGVLGRWSVKLAHSIMSDYWLARINP